MIKYRSSSIKAVAFILTVSLFVMSQHGAAFGYSSAVSGERAINPDQTAVSADSLSFLNRFNHAMQEVANVVRKSVVNVSTIENQHAAHAENPTASEPSKNKQGGSMGSGVIVDASGYILTNNHVVKDAISIKVKLSDNREFKGVIVGTDAKSDLAVIKIDAQGLPAMKWGDSDNLTIGDTVLAVGNPYGLNQTVTSGIVSAKGRVNVGVADYEDFIQTDAAINPGNSGGALVNINAELVGINTAILSTSGGYQGIGFAIPSDMARTIMTGLIKDGKFVRGWFGVATQAVTEELSKQFGFKDTKGVLVSDVVEKSPAQRADIRRGDVLLEYNGREITDSMAIRNLVADTMINQTVLVKLRRGEAIVLAEAKISELPATDQMSVKSTQRHFNNAFDRINTQNLTPEIRKSFNVPERINGVIVTFIEDGPMDSRFLTENDIIMEVNQKPVSDQDDYDYLASTVEAGHNVLLLVYRSHGVIYVILPVKSDG